jgi:hypothetical protein
LESRDYEAISGSINIGKTLDNVIQRQPKYYNTYDFGTVHAANLTVKKTLNSDDKEEIIRVLA